MLKVNLSLWFLILKVALISSTYARTLLEFPNNRKFDIFKPIRYKGNIPLPTFLMNQFEDVTVLEGEERHVAFINYVMMILPLPPFVDKFTK